MTTITKELERRSEHIFAGRGRPYQMCTRCIMDTTDPEIEFDADGVCHHCHDYDYRVSREVFPSPGGHQRLAAMVAQIKREGRRKRYDCILGLSGGVDSSYTAYLTKQLGLRPLALHLDNGWNSDIAVRNIHNIVRTLELDLETHVLDWEEFRSLQLAFLRASTPDSEIPSDHAIVSSLYQAAAKHGVRWIMDGSNVVTEIMVPATWSHGHSDWGYINGLNEAFGERPLKTYPHYSYFQLHLKYRGLKRIQRLPLLNYVDYDKPRAVEIIKRELGWESYGAKHYESVYTKFYQGHILPEKFGFDKRRPHLSCLVNDGRISREEALAQIERPAIDPEELRRDRVFVAKKLGLSETEFDEIMALPRKTFWDYPSDERDLPGTFRYRLGWGVYTFVARLAYLGGLVREVVLHPGPPRAWPGLFVRAVKMFGRVGFRVLRRLARR
jgi:N-acetyl sugar amidotransferase